MKLPPRKILRSIVEDAISDREEMQDADPSDETRALIGEYRAFIPRLADDAPPLSEDDKDILVKACHHARIWREGYLDAWINTGDKPIILAARQDIDRVKRTEEALGVIRHWLRGGIRPAGVTHINILELRTRSKAEGWINREFGSPLPS